MNTKNQDLDESKSKYQDHLRGRKKPKNEERFEAGFDYGYEKGLWAAWSIFQKNRDTVIEEEKKYCGIFKNYHASFVCHELMNLVSDYKRVNEAYQKYKPIECFCEKCGKLK